MLASISVGHGVSAITDCQYVLRSPVKSSASSPKMISSSFPASINVTGLAPHRSSRCSSTWRVARWGSWIRMVGFAKAISGCRSSAKCANKGSVKEKVAPWPNSLLTLMAPPMHSISCRQIVSPRPLPPNWREWLGSACENALNNCFCCSSLKPMPVSLTLIFSTTCWPSWVSSITRTITSPCVVNFKALLIRLLST